MFFSVSEEEQVSGGGEEEGEGESAHKYKCTLF
jgi:hypothetical protein